MIPGQPSSPRIHHCLSWACKNTIRDPTETEQGLDLGPLNNDCKIQYSLAASIRKKKKKKLKLCASGRAYLAGMEEDAYYKDWQGPDQTNLCQRRVRCWTFTNLSPHYAKTHTETWRLNMQMKHTMYEEACSVHCTSAPNFLYFPTTTCLNITPYLPQPL